MYSNLSSVALRNVAHLGGKDFPFLMNLSVFGSKNLDFCKEVICFPNNCFRVQKKKQTKNKNLAPPTLKYLITEKYYPILVEIKGKLYT